MKMIKATELYGKEIYVVIKHILAIGKYEYAEGHSVITLPGGEIFVKGTPEQIVAMIHEVEGK